MGTGKLKRMAAVGFMIICLLSTIMPASAGFLTDVAAQATVKCSCGSRTSKNVTRGTVTGYNDKTHTRKPRQYWWCSQCRKNVRSLTLSAKTENHTPVRYDYDKKTNEDLMECKDSDIGCHYKWRRKHKHELFANGAPIQWYKNAADPKSKEWCVQATCPWCNNTNVTVWYGKDKPQNITKGSRVYE